MKHDLTRNFGLALATLCVALAGLATGCTSDKQASNEVPYGQAAPPDAQSPMATAPNSEVPPGTKMAPLLGSQGTPAEQPGAGAPPPGPKMAGGGAPMGGPAGSSAPMSSGGAAGAGPMMGGGPMSGGVSPTSPLTPTPQLDKDIADAVAKKDKKAIAAAYASRGYERMTDDNAGARVKYRAALTDFKEALKNDPTNAKAKENKTMIENIYHQMGRPVPGEEGTAPAP